MEVSLLEQNKDKIVHMIKSFQPLTGFDFSVVDENRKRIAGTGKYEWYIGLTLPENTATDVALKTEAPVWLDNPLHDPICQTCTIRSLCFKESAIIHPIMLNRKVIGTIAISAFTNEQKQRYKSEEDHLKSVIKILAESISNNIQEQILTARMEVALNYVDEGIIITNKEGNILFANTKSQALLQQGDKRHIQITDMLTTNYIKNLLKSNESFEQIKVSLNRFLGDKQFYISGRQLTTGITDEFLFIIMENSAIAANGQESVSADAGDEIKGISKAIKQTKYLARQAARVDSNVLIQGESGTGKELFAQYIHQQSDRKDSPFVSINCAAIPENLIESELFGYEEGAFTGAKRSGKAGKFERAHNGTLFLDEIGDLALKVQPKLLQAIENGHVERVGGTSPLQLNVRIIAATNRPLEKMVKASDFREDLFYRLNVIPLTLPPLKDRREDILVVANFLLAECNKKFSTHINGFSKKSEEALFLYDWPGNIRELINAIEYAVHLEQTSTIQVESIPAVVADNSSSHLVGGQELNIKQIESDTIETLFEKYGTSLEGKRKTAEQLGISLSTLYRRLRNK